MLLSVVLCFCARSFNSVIEEFSKVTCTVPCYFIASKANRMYSNAFENSGILRKC